MSTSRTSQFRQNLGGSREELQAFVASLHGRSAAESMGTMARSQLVRAMTISVLAQGIIMLLLTVPFAFRTQAKAAPPVQVPALSNAPAPVTPAATAPVAGAAPAPAAIEQPTSTPSPKSAGETGGKRPGASMDDLDLDRLIQ